MASLLLSGCKHAKRDVNQLFIQENAYVPAAEIRHFKAYYTLKGDVALVLKAPVMKDYSNYDFQTQIFPAGVDILIKNRNGNGHTRVQADKAVLYKQTELTELIGNVKITGEKGESLTTGRLFWDKQNEHLFTDSHVRFQRGDEYIEGTGFDSNMRFSNARVNDVEGIFHIKTGK